MVLKQDLWTTGFHGKLGPADRVVTGVIALRPALLLWTRRAA